jgi:hypothetical protein
MSNEKTTQFADASTLDGTELVGIVQGETNVQSTTYNISNFVNTRTFVQMGKGAHGGTESGVAIGYYAYAIGTNQIAIGNSAYAVANQSISIGYRATTANQGAVSIGTHCYNHGNYAVAIGGHAFTNGTYAIAVGAYSSAEGHCIAIGAYAKAYTTYSIAIGQDAKAYGIKSVTIGYHAKTVSSNAVAIGYGSYAGYNSTAIGARARCFDQYSVSIGIGSECLASYSVAIGPYTYTLGSSGLAVGPYCHTLASKGIALGAYSVSRSSYSMAIGAHSTSAGIGATALGAFAESTNDHSIVLGSPSTDVVVGSLVINGYPVEAALTPSEHYQKFVGHTVAPIEANVIYSGEGWTITFTYDTPGPDGNAFIVESNVSGTPSASASVTFSDDTLQVLLGSDSDDVFDPTKNTIAQIAALFPSNGFSFAYTGPSDTVVTGLDVADFSGGIDGTPSGVLTADGNSPTSTNTLAMSNGAIATLTGRVTAANVGIFTDEGDAACFVLSPLLLYRDSGGTYNFVGTPTFTLENSTEGAVDWDVPTLAVDEDTGYLEVSVVNNAVEVWWMGHFKFETSQ